MNKFIPSSSRKPILATLLMASVTFSVTGAYAMQNIGASPAVTSVAQKGGLDPDGPAPLNKAAIDRLVDDTGARVSLWRATGTARFISFGDSAAEKMTRSLLPAGKVAARDLADAFFTRYADAFGVKDPAREMVYDTERVDAHGMTRVTYAQHYKGVPVFASKLHAHINAEGKLVAVNGLAIPDITLNTAAKITAQRAGEAAMTEVLAKKQSADGKAPTDVHTGTPKLYVFRTNLVRGLAGSDYLVYEVEVTNHADVNEWLYIDAHTGKLVEQFSGVFHNTGKGVSDAPTALKREVYEGTLSPNTRIWQEGDAVPFVGNNAEQTRDTNSLISTAQQTYNLFRNAFGWTSFDNKDSVMKMINNTSKLRCPNAQWNGEYTQFCNGVAGDDTVAHEWAHAYTQYTDNLIYAWQPGAMNEAYSDIWGEVVDMLNRQGKDTDLIGPRSVNGDMCSVHTTPYPQLSVLSPAAIAGNLPVGNAEFGPKLTLSGLSGEVVLANDGRGGTSLPLNATTENRADACTAIINKDVMAGKIALVYRGTCTFAEKVKNAQNAGAIGVIVMNHAEGGDRVLNMSGADESITIPTVLVGYSNGAAIVEQLAANATVNVRMSLSGGQERDNTYRWLSGEDDPSLGEPIRDMWNPTCYRDPGKVSDTEYWCETGDNGGVHHNSGVINHGFALLADGGNYNGQNIRGLGMTKVAHIYWRTQTEYQVRVSDFADHADALEQSCRDLRGKALKALSIGADVGASGESITDDDCAQVAKLTQAIELRKAPLQCEFEPLLAKNEPPMCTDRNGPAKLVFNANFESNPIVTDTLNIPASAWTISNTQFFSGFPVVDWAWTGSKALPGGRNGKAVFADNLIDEDGNCSEDVGDSTRLMSLLSPIITLPGNTTVPQLSFNHYVMTEFEYDGGNLKISVNGGPFKSIERRDFSFNPYNTQFKVGSALVGDIGFSGSDGGTVKGSWGKSRVNLSNYAKPGDKIQIRFDFGTDGCGGLNGWYVDDVEVFYCENQITSLPVKAEKDLIVPDGKTFVPVTATVRTSTGPVANELVLLTSGRFVVPLSGIDEVPPVTTTATGKADFSYDVNTRNLFYRIEAQGLISVTGMHIHVGEAGANGQVAINLPVPSSFPARPAVGTITLSDLGELTLLTNGFYINIHTPANPNGELRGHIADGHFTSLMSGRAEVPANDSAGRGKASWTYDPNTRTLYYWVNVSGLSNVTAAHIHRGKAGENGPVAYDLLPSGIQLQPNVPLQGAVVLSKDDEARLYNDLLYINVHTQAVPSGEIRGQILGGMIGASDANGNVVVMVSAVGPMGSISAISADSRGMTSLLSPSRYYVFPLIFGGEFNVP